jgi:hypothetical protein
MNTKLTLLLAVTTAILAFVCYKQAQTLSKTKTEMVSLRGKVEASEERLREVQASKDYLSHSQRDLLQQISVQSEQLRTNPLAARPNTGLGGGPGAGQAEGAKGDQEGAGFGKIFSKMMQDPDTKKFIQEQQKMVMEKLYAPLFKKMALTPEEADNFKNLLTDNAMRGAEKAGSIFGGPGATNRAEVLSAVAADSKASEERIKQLLGDARYAEYKEYQQTAGDRMQLNLFQQQFGAGENRFSEDQTERLLALMKEEKQAVAAAGVSVPGQGDDRANIEAMMSDEHTEALLQSQESVDQRVLERAQTVLTPEQLNTFARFQTNRLQTMRMGMTMARKFLGPDKPAGAATPAH